MGYLNRFSPFILMGFSSMLLQITVLRLLLSTFSGNELDIGITLSFWLIYVGLGSLMYKRLRFKHAFIVSFVFIALFTQPTALAIKAIRPALSLEPGEVVSFTYTILSTAIILFPLCFVIGTQFPLAVSYSGGKDNAGLVYGLEAIGAFIAGIMFTFIISGKILFMELCLLISIFNILIALYISKRKVISLIFIFPLSFYFIFSTIAITLPWKGLRISQNIESKYGEITVVEMEGQSSIYTNGQLLFTYPNVPDEEFRAHLIMSLHASPSKVLVIGGSPGILRELLKYPDVEIDFVEIDPQIVNISFGMLNSEDSDILKNDRLNIIVEDGRRFVKRLKNAQYDLIFLNLPQPFNASINRFYTSNFFEEAKMTLKEDGILALKLPFSAGYIGRSMKTANGSIYNSLRNVFKYVAVTSQEYGGLFASQSPLNPDPEKLGGRFTNRMIKTEYFNRYIFLDVFSPFGSDYVKHRLSEINIVNTDLKPSAYLYNLMLWSEKHGGKIIRYLIEIKIWHIFSVLIITLLFLSITVYKRRNRIIYYSIFTTGFSSMSFVIAIILVYQSLFGYIYEMIGILYAMFMVGLWIGTCVIRNKKRSLHILLYLEILTVILALIMPLLFKAEGLFYLLILFSGILTGAQFSTANLSIIGFDTAGKIYGFDLIGSFIGAFLSSIILIPLFGVQQTLIVIAVVKAVSAVMIFNMMKTGKTAVV